MEFFVHIPGASRALCVPLFLRCAHMVDVEREKKKVERERGEKNTRGGRKGWRERERVREKKRGKVREKGIREGKREKREDVSAGILAPCHLWERDTSFSLDALLRFRIVTQPFFAFYASLFLSFSPLSCLFPVPSPSLFRKENRCRCENVSCRRSVYENPTRHQKFVFLRRWRLTLPLPSQLGGIITFTDT